MVAMNYIGAQLQGNGPTIYRYTGVGVVVEEDKRLGDLD